MKNVMLMVNGSLCGMGGFEKGAELELIMHTICSNNLHIVGVEGSNGVVIIHATPDEVKRDYVPEYYTDDLDDDDFYDTLEEIENGMKDW